MTTDNRSKVRKMYEFALIQIAAESYLEQRLAGGSLPEILQAGANNLTKSPSKDDRGNYIGSTRMTESQADWFVKNYSVERSIGNTASGFSAAQNARVRSFNNSFNTIKK